MPAQGGPRRPVLLVSALETLIARAMRDAVAAGRAAGETGAELDARALDAAGEIMTREGRTGSVDTETLTVKLDESLS